MEVVARHQLCLQLTCSECQRLRNCGSATGRLTLHLVTGRRLRHVAAIVRKVWAVVVVMEAKTATVVAVGVPVVHPRRMVPSIRRRCSGRRGHLDRVSLRLPRPVQRSGLVLDNLLPYLNLLTLMIANAGHKRSVNETSAVSGLLGTTAVAQAPVAQALAVVNAQHPRHLQCYHPNLLHKHASVKHCHQHGH